MANETQTTATELKLGSPEVAAAARAAGYRSARLGPALYALEKLSEARGYEQLACEFIRCDIARLQAEGR
jgi:hypothetical protein